MLPRPSLQPTAPTRFARPRGIAAIVLGVALAAVMMIALQQGLGRVADALFATLLALSAGFAVAGVFLVVKGYMPRRFQYVLIALVALTNLIVSIAQRAL